MKILLVAGKLSYSNPTVYTQQLVAGLPERSHEIQVAVHGGPLVESLVGVQIYSIKHNFLSRRRCRLIRDFDPQLVHSTGGMLALEAARKIATAIGRPICHTLHSWLPEDRRLTLATGIDGVIAVNEVLREHLVNDLEVAKSKVKVLPYGVARSEPPEPPPAREGRIPVVGTIGRLDHGRRHDVFLHMAKAVSDAIGPVQFVVAGEGPNEVKLFKLTRRLGLEEFVTFAPPASGIDIYSVVDILVIVSDYGGVGLTILDSMRAGCPVLATGGGEIFGAFDRENVCEVVATDAPDALAESVIRLLGDVERRRELAVNAHEYVCSHYPLEAHLVALEEFYAELAGRT